MAICQAIGDALSIFIFKRRYSLYFLSVNRGHPRDVLAGFSMNQNEAIVGRNGAGFPLNLSLLISQGINGIQAGGLVGRVIPKENSHSGGKEKRDK
jgi:hypothetical protein